MALIQPAYWGDSIPHPTAIEFGPYCRSCINRLVCEGFIDPDTIEESTGDDGVFLWCHECNTTLTDDEGGE